MQQVKKVGYFISVFCLLLTLFSPARANVLDAENPAAFFPLVQNPKLTAPSAEWGEIKKPYPTSAWFNNFALKGENDEQVGMQPVYPLPYSIMSSEGGLIIGLPASEASFARNADNTIYAQMYSPGEHIKLSADTENTSIKHTITQGNELAVTLRYTLSQDQYMTAPIVRGSPYVTMFYHDLKPLIMPLVGLKKVNGKNPGESITGTRFEMVLALSDTETQTWVLYSEKPITLTWRSSVGGKREGWQLVMSTPYTGWLRVALLADTKLKIENNADLLDQYANNVPLNGKVSYQYKDNIATMTFDWETDNHQPPLLMTLPHQREILQEASMQTISMPTIKGTMYGIASQTWTMQESLPVAPFLEVADISKFSKEQREAILEALERDAATVDASISPKNIGVYTSGKGFARAARLALIADLFGKKELTATIISTIEQNMVNWMRGEKNFYLSYDTVYGGIISAIDDFGSQGYNDHHYHYGYFAYTFAVIAKLDPLWLNKSIQVNNKQIKPLQWISTLIRDYANPEINDAYFPYSRHADAFDGHSYASGIAGAARDGRNQESVSEAVNAYYGMALLGQVLQDEKLTNWSKMLLARELRAAHVYYQVRTDSDIYDKLFIKENQIAVNLWNGKADAHSWFGPERHHSYGIEMLPFTAITSQLLSGPWIKQAYPDITETYLALPATNAWKSFMLKGRLFGAKAEDYPAIWSEALTHSVYDDGDSHTNTLFIIAARMQ